jgi:protein-tyrosine phosphatase
MSYVDLHCHLLPGIDDGAATPGDTLAYAARLEAEGVRDVACTPHVKRAEFPRVRIEELAGLRARTQAMLAEAGLHVRLHGGGELSHEDAAVLGREELDAIAQGPRDGRWLLLECPFAGIDAAFLDAVERLRELGYGLLLAHPERSAGLLQGGGLDALAGRLGPGVEVQVNACSLLGNHGLAAQAAALTLLRRRLVFALASDAHPGTREHTLQLGFHLLLRAGAASERALRLTQDNPRLLLERGLPTAAAGPVAAPLAA